MNKAEKIILINAKLSGRQFDMLLTLEGYGHEGMRTDDRSEWRHCDSLVSKGFAERNLTATMPRHYRITETGTARLYNPAKLVKL
jgi:hypothetical protein